jgi:uncharacterized protein (TIGR02145 family)
MKNKTLINPSLLVFSGGLLMLLISGCRKESAVLPTVKLNAVTLVTTNSASGEAEILSDGGAPVTSCGLCWLPEQTPTIDHNKTSYALTRGSFTGSITGLTANTRYHLRAYAVNSAGIGYSDTKSFQTLFETITDIDGNVYNVAKIGNQTWMVENLKTTRYRNGDPIPEVINFWDWAWLPSEAYCWNCVTDNENKGVLYNYYVVTDSRGLAPVGWHVPSSADWITLINSAGNDPCTYLYNKGFSMTRGGFRDGYTGEFENLGIAGYWWSSDRFLAVLHTEDLGPSLAISVISKHPESRGYSIRCIKD